MTTDTLDGYIRASFLVNSDAHIVASIVSDRDSVAYGPFCRRFIRATCEDGSSWAGSCRADQDFVQLKRCAPFEAPLLNEYLGRVTA